MAAMKKLPPVKQKKIVQQAITKRASAPPRRNVPTLPAQASDRARQAIASRPVLMAAPTPPSILPQQLSDGTGGGSTPFIPPVGPRSIDGGWIPGRNYEDGSTTNLSPSWGNAIDFLDRPYNRHPELDAYLAILNADGDGTGGETDIPDPRLPGYAPPYYDPEGVFDTPDLWDRLMRLFNGRRS